MTGSSSIVSSGLAPLVDHRRVDVRLEGRADLAQRLRGAIEFRFAEIAAADHRFDSAGGIVDRQQRALRAGVLLQAHARCAVGLSDKILT